MLPRIHLQPIPQENRGSLIPRKKGTMQQVLEETRVRTVSVTEEARALDILFIAPLPPPVHGQSLASKVFLDELSKRHRITVVDMAKMKTKGVWAGVRRVYQIVSILTRIAAHVRRADRIYLTISQSFWGNLKDLLVYLICFGKLDRMVIHLHGGASMERIMHGNPVAAAVNAFFLSKVQAVVILGESHRGIFAGAVPQEKIRVVPNFAEDWLFIDEERLEAKFSEPGRVQFLYLSNFLPGKGYEEILEAWEGLPGAVKERASIHFAGAFNSESMKRKFLRRIEGDGKLNYHGVVGGAEKKSLLHSSHVFCLPTYYANEGQPISILEAYASGCAVITTGHSGIPDIFTDGENGFRVEKRSVASLREAMASVLARPGALMPIAARNRKMAQGRFRTEAYNAALESILFSVRGGPGASPLAGNARPYRICSNCVMDTSDSEITFDAQGVCDHCGNFYKSILPSWHPDETGERELSKIVARIKEEGKGKEFDCIMGMSGGVDSSYLTYIVKEKFGLRPLVFHVDAGWNSQEAVNNIERMVDKLGLDLYTEVIDWEEMRDLQLAFFKAGVPHLDTPQDHAFFATMYNFAAKHKIKYILTGANYSTECVKNPLEWHYHASDLVQIRDIHRRFGTRPLRKFPLANVLRYKVFYRYFKGVRVVKPLDYVPYVKEDAVRLLSERFGWQKYAQKHFESRFTKFYEAYWQPMKFGIDKRRAQFSSLILTKQMTREEALEKLSKPAYDPRTLKQDFEYIATKLGITPEELQACFDAPNKSYRDYRNQLFTYVLGTKIMIKLGLEKRAIR